MSDYPEHDKMNAKRPELDAVTDFLEVLEAGELTYGGRRLYLAIREEGWDRLMPADPGIASLLAQWAGIDQDAIEREKRAILASLQTEVEHR